MRSATGWTYNNGNLTTSVARVGIGNDTPQYGKLHINNDEGENGGIALIDGGDSFRIYKKNNVAFITRQGNDLKGLSIGSGGNIGINTSNPQEN